MIGFDAAVMIGGLVAALRRRRAGDESDGATLSSAGMRAAIIVRHHGRQRRPATARIVATPAWPPPEPDDESASAVNVIGAVPRGDEPGSLLLTDEDTAELLRSLGKLGKAATELLADQGMTIGEPMTAVLDRAAGNTRGAVDLTILVWPDGPSNGPGTMMPRP